MTSREVYLAFEAQLLPLLKTAMKKHARATRGKVRVRARGRVRVRANPNP